MSEPGVPEEVLRNTEERRPLDPQGLAIEYGEVLTEMFGQTRGVEPDGHQTISMTSPKKKWPQVNATLVNAFPQFQDYIPSKYFWRGVLFVQILHEDGKRRSVTIDTESIGDDAVITEEHTERTSKIGNRAHEQAVQWLQEVGTAYNFPPQEYLNS